MRRPLVILGDGNAFAIMAACSHAARRAGWTPEEWESVRDDMTSRDYEHLLAVVAEYFEVEVNE